MKISLFDCHAARVSGLRNFHFRSVTTILPVVLFALSLAPKSGASVLLSENFSTAIGGTYSGAITGSQFKATENNVDIIGVLNGAFFSCEDNSGGNCLDLIGNEGLGQITSVPTFTLTAGDTYTVTFGVVVQGIPNSLDFSVGLGSLSQTETALATPEHLTVTFTPSANQIGAALIFTSLTSVNNVNGAVLDNIVLTETSSSPSAAPEPASMMLALVGLLGGVGGVFKLRKAR